jgi:hypothetical protein
MELLRLNKNITLEYVADQFGLVLKKDQKIIKINLYSNKEFEILDNAYLHYSQKIAEYIADHFQALIKLYRS